MSGSTYYEDLAGRRFGRLVASHRSYSKKYYPSFYGATWVCQCDCGNTCEVLAVNLKTGRTRSCGCLRSDNASEIIEKNRKTIPGKKHSCHGEMMTVREISNRYDVKIATIYSWIEDGKDLETMLDSFLRRRERRNENVL